MKEITTEFLDSFNDPCMETNRTEPEGKMSLVYTFNRITNGRCYYIGVIKIRYLFLIKITCMAFAL